MKKSLWLPALITPVVVAAAVAAPSVANAASATPSAASVLASIAKSSGVQYSGKLTQTSDLGLPSLPSTSGSSEIESNASGVLDLLTSSHSARIYVGGTDKARVQLLGSLSEQDVILNGTDLWTWDSKKNRATHLTLPSESSATPAPTATPTPGTTPSLGTATPTQIATQAIKAITPTTRVGTPTSTTVAGRAAWTVTLTPKASDTLVRRIALSVDQRTGLPLAAEVDAKGQSKPAISVDFSSISFSAPASRLFDFTPPTHAKVTTKNLSKAPASSWKHSDAMRQGTIEGTVPSASASPTVLGSGWGAIVELPAGTADFATKNADGSQLYAQLTKAVDGGRAISTSLVTVFIASDGRVFAGAVPVSALTAAAK